MSSRISIHSLRGEGDAEYLRHLVIVDAISIHSLRGEGDLAMLKQKVGETEFQSTPSVGRETNQKIYITQLKAISIHSLRGEGDGIRLPFLSRS